ncbi:DUF5711 family protein [Herbivorax sp. ANBcel31]|uniref:DUF5711 family protein n=1 Tax=Herbivorax sp. ANBcel31 TaxID=3069754 RepID=UPI0027AE898B|nr:DUF5711 family protein [Herbivorax sp. ANBcel31]MDQ2086698.1 DUF5711 family protein [Herbivorax sp. ANBcel31]
MDIPRKDTKFKKRHGRFNIFLFIVLILIIISTSAGAYLNLNEIDLKNTSIKELFENRFYLGSDFGNKEVLLEMSYDSSANAKFALHDDYIVKCTQGRIDFIDKRGEARRTFRGSLKNPLIKSKGNYLLIADFKGKDMFVFRGINKLWEEKLNNNIINADINEKGHVAVVHEEEMSRNAASAFNREGVRYFVDNSGDEFILSAKVSPDGDSILLNYAITSGIGATTELKKYNIESKEQIEKTVVENEFFPFAEYIDDDTIMAVGDSYIAVLGDNLEEKWSASAKGKVYSSSAGSDKYVIAATELKGAGFFSNRKSDILIYDMGGERVADLNIENHVKNMVVYDDIIAVNLGRQLYIINSQGKIIDEYDFTTEIKYIDFFNKKEILVIVENKIIILNI